MITYKDFMKHAEVVTRSPAIVDRQILKGVKHLEDGSLAVTDSHRLYIATDMHGRTDGAVLDTKGKVIEGNYPEVKRLVPYHEPEQEITVKLKDLITTADIIYSVIGKEGYHVIDLREDSISYQVEDISINIKQEVTFKVPLSLNVKYLLDALKLLKSTGCDEITIKFYSRMRPILFEAENVQAIIVPVRRV